MGSIRSEVPSESTSFVGREQELRDIDDRVRASKIVTLVGVGGTGKTRIAVEFAARNNIEPKVVFVDLAPLSQAAMLPQAFFDAIGLQQPRGQDFEKELVEGLRPLNALLIVDNCEHLLGAASKLIERLVSECPHIRVLATSREPLRAYGEVTVTVPSLLVPGDGVVDRNAEFPAVRLFLDRAKIQDAAFMIDDENAASVSAICRRLDGIPFAIELATTRLKAMSPNEIHLWLNDKFRLLTGGMNTAVKRHQTLKSLLDWSYDLLDDNEKNVLNAVSCFRGVWTLELAMQICIVGGIDPADVLDLHSSLIERSFITTEVQDDQVVYRMLETVREYAADRLSESGEASTIRDLHAATLLALAERTKGELRGLGRGAAIKVLDRNLDNLRAALIWTCSNPDQIETALRLCGALWLYWSVRGRFAEGRNWISEALDGSLQGLPFAIVGEVFNGASVLSLLQGDLECALSMAQKAIDLFRKTPERIGLANALNALGNSLTARGQNDEAKAVFKRSLDIRREEGDDHGVAASLNNLGALALESGDAPTAEEFFMESATINKKIGDIDALAVSLKNAGSSAFQQGDLRTARSLFEESVDLVRKAGNRPRIAAFEAHVAMAAAQQGDLGHARQLFEFALRERIEFGDQRGQVDSETDLAYMFLLEGDYAASKDGLSAALQRRLEMKDPWGESATKYYLGIACLSLGDISTARKVLTELRDSRENSGDKRGLAYCELWVGRLDLLRGARAEAARHTVNALDLFVSIRDRLGAVKAFESVTMIVRVPPEDACEFLGAAERLRSVLGAQRHRYEQRLLDGSIDWLREVLGDKSYEAAFQDGSRMTFEHAVQCAQNSLKKILVEDGRSEVE